MSFDNDHRMPSDFIVESYFYVSSSVGLEVDTSRKMDHTAWSDVAHHIINTLT